jgi:polysaccharide biosynthesis/export protein
VGRLRCGVTWSQVRVIVVFPGIDGKLGVTMKLISAVLSCLLIMAGCTTTGAGTVPLATTEIPVPDDTAFLSGGDIRISPLDRLTIKVSGSTGVDGAYQVDPSGQIRLPLLGEVDVKGYTTFELAARLEDGFRAQYLRNPQVTVQIAESNGQQFTIEGAIGRPGMYPVKGRMSLLQAIALSGGPLPAASLDGIVIFRTIEGKRQAARFDLQKIRKGESVDPAIYGNDIIVVDGRVTETAFDEVLKNLPLVGMFITLF